MCAKRLIIQIPHWLVEYEAIHGSVETSLRQLLLTISATSIDRVLKQRRDEWYAAQSLVSNTTPPSRK